MKCNAIYLGIHLNQPKMLVIIIAYAWLGSFPPICGLWMISMYSSSGVSLSTIGFVNPPSSAPWLSSAVSASLSLTTIELSWDSFVVEVLLGGSSS